STADAERAALEVIHWKTVPYTVLRPVRIGAALLGAGPGALEALSRWSIEIGTAFQLRDDLLSVVGDTDQTGKPIGGDIEEGRRRPGAARAAGTDCRAHRCPGLGRRRGPRAHAADRGRGLGLRGGAGAGSACRTDPGPGRGPRGRGPGRAGGPGGSGHRGGLAAVLSGGSHRAKVWARRRTSPR